MKIRYILIFAFSLPFFFYSNCGQQPLSINKGFDATSNYDFSNQSYDTHQAKQGVILGVFLNQAFIDQLGNIGSWYFRYSLHPNSIVDNNYVNSVSWANKYNKEFVPMIPEKRFKYDEGEESCALLDDFLTGANDHVCTIDEMVAAIEQMKALFNTTNQPKYLMVFNEPHQKGADLVGNPTTYLMSPLQVARAWGRIQKVGEQTNLKLLTPATSIEPVAVDYFTQFLKSCHDLRNDPNYPCDVETIYAINNHAYECKESYWVDNYLNKGFQKTLIQKMGNYGGRDWKDLIMSRKIWLTETTCNWDQDVRKEQSQGRYVRSSKESCLRATGQRADFGDGSLATISSLGDAEMERFAWWTLHIDPYKHSDVGSITASSLNRILASRLYDENYQQTPIGRAYYQAFQDPTKMDQVDCESLNHYLADHYRCEFTLQSQNGASWKVVRKSLRDDGCQMATFAVKNSNPNATVANPVKIFVGADNGLANKYNSTAHRQGYFWQCQFEMQGAQGAKWWVYRNTDIDDNCAKARANISASNPSATIITGPLKIFIGGDHGFKRSNSKVYKNATYWECHFDLTGSSGAQWKSVRYTDIDDNCVAAKVQVENNNPNASVSQPIKIFSGLDF